MHLKKVILSVVVVALLGACGSDSSDSSSTNEEVTNEVSTLSDGLVAYYKFDGNANDSSGNGNDGVEHGGVTYVDGVIGQAGKFGYNIVDYIEVTKDFEIGKEWTFTEWVNLNINSSHIISIATEYNINEFLIYPHKDFRGEFHFAVNDVVIAGHNPIPNINDNQWHLVILKSDGQMVSFYIDGILYETFTDIQDLDITSQNLIIGQEQDSLGGGFVLDESLNGMVDDFRIYNRALDEAEIAELYQMGSQ